MEGFFVLVCFLLWDGKCLSVILRVVVYEGCENQRLNEIMMKFRSEVTRQTNLGTNLNFERWKRCRKSSDGRLQSQTVLLATVLTVVSPHAENYLLKNPDSRVLKTRARLPRCFWSGVQLRGWPRHLTWVLAGQEPWTINRHSNNLSETVTYFGEVQDYYKLNSTPAGEHYKCRLFWEHVALGAPSDVHFWPSTGTSRLNSALQVSSKVVREVACSVTC